VDDVKTLLHNGVCLPSSSSSSAVFFNKTNGILKQFSMHVKAAFSRQEIYLLSIHKRVSSATIFALHRRRLVLIARAARGTRRTK